MHSLKKITSPLAITMWDTSWIRRHYRRGGFEDWDKALDELVARGYNAVRIDPHPHMVADGPGGERVEKFRCIPNRGHQTYATAMWGNPWTVTIEPRAALLEFIPKCEQRGIYIGLSTWFKSSEDGRFEQIEGEAELVRVWDETLLFLKDHELLNNVIYVDVLNEYPKSNDFVWLKKMLSTM
ncbi:MAG: hypothetical protein LC725_10390, partial [Lentisphaerae bacterium]|nr:hypothetical protein [Lentisphaerota bacterium]